ncbi:MAG: polyphosphate kinase 1 [Kiritimatiellae bacterium]|nr:polyphosphate kinase 1 [Kiritimatiellia bacterium]
MAVAARKLFLNRELSWLEFNHRVLEQALDRDVPLLERLKFLAITASNLDEFFMVRVGGLQMLVDEGVMKADPARMTPAEQLTAIGARVQQMVDAQYRGWHEGIEPLLAQAGIRRVRPRELTEEQARHVEYVFENEVYPVLSPIAVTDPARIPLVVNLLLNLAVRLRPETGADDRPRYALIPIGRNMPRFITLPTQGGYHFLLVEDLVGMFVERFFAGEPVLECAPFRITRNADLSVREDLAGDLLLDMEAVLEARKRSDCVRLEADAGMTKTLLHFLQSALKVRRGGVYRLAGPLDLAAFMSLAAIEGYDELKDRPWPPQPVPEIEPGSGMFDTLAAQPLLLYHPYDTFEPVLRFVQEAAEDPDVVAIKQILYRTSRNSPVVAALLRAAERGKHVTVIVELRARFDEARNIERARELEDAGVQVIYGVKGLKTHGKVCVVVRREAQGLQRYVHWGTGNYNEETAKLYSDAGYMTCDEDLGADATSFFNAVTGYSQPQKFRKIEMAPIGLRERVLACIESETERRRQGQKAFIMAKVNSLVDTQIIQALYAASQAGVNVQLNVRGICCLRPGVAGLSENISVVSIVDRFLEHSRILRVYNGGDEKVFISSADWMPRNLDRRVELLVPVEDPAARRRLQAILETYFKDTVNAWRLLPSGQYERVRPPSRRRRFRAQESLYARACERVRKEQDLQRTMFEAHRPSSAQR